MTSQSGSISQLPGKELKQNLADRKDKIMQLSTLFSHVSPSAKLLIELKDQSGSLGPTTGILEKADTQALEGYEGPVAVVFFSPATLKAMARRQNPKNFTNCRVLTIMMRFKHPF